MAIINERIKKLRKEKGLTLLQSAEALGIKEATMQRYESGEIKTIKHDKILKLATLFDVSPSYLMGFENQTIGTTNIKGKPALSPREQKLLDLYQSAKKSNDPKERAIADLVDRALGMDKK